LYDVRKFQYCFCIMLFLFFCVLGCEGGVWCLVCGLLCGGSVWCVEGCVVEVCGMRECGMVFFGGALFFVLKSISWEDSDDIR
jgi:hypothetical protein